MHHGAQRTCCCATQFLGVRGLRHSPGSPGFPLPTPRCQPVLSHGRLQGGLRGAPPEEGKDESAPSCRPYCGMGLASWGSSTPHQPSLRVAENVLLRRAASGSNLTAIPLKETHMASIRSSSLGIARSALLCWALCSLSQPALAQTHYTASWASLDTHDPAPEWFQDAKFGVVSPWAGVSMGKGGAGS